MLQLRKSVHNFSCAVAVGASLFSGAVAIAQDRLVIVGDLHGDGGAYKDVLEGAGLIDSDGDWIGGDATLVQMGDVADRGPDTRQIFKDLQAITQQAKRAGGSVYVLVGNHEAMNVVGDLRYVHPGEYAAFATKRSERLRNRYIREAKDQLIAAGRAQDPERSEDDIIAAWKESHPLGWLEHRAAWAANGEIGSYIGGLPSVVVLGDNLFVHAGLYGGQDLETASALNQRVSTALAERDVSDETVLYDDFGPLWYRGMASNPCAEERANIDRIKTFYGVSRIFIAHTPTGGAIVPRCSGDVVLTDVGLSAAYGGHRGWVERNDGVWSAGYPDGLRPMPLGDVSGLEAYLDWTAGLSDRSATFAAQARE